MILELIIVVLSVWVGYLLYRLKTVPPLFESVQPVIEIGPHCCGECNVGLPLNALKTHDGFWRCKNCKIRLLKEQ